MCGEVGVSWRARWVRNRKRCHWPREPLERDDQTSRRPIRATITHMSPPLGLFKLIILGSISSGILELLFFVKQVLSQTQFRFKKILVLVLGIDVRRQFTTINLLEIPSWGSCPNPTQATDHGNTAAAYSVTSGIWRNTCMNDTGMKNFAQKQYKQNHTVYLAVCTSYVSLVASGVKIYCQNIRYPPTIHKGSDWVLFNWDYRAHTWDSRNFCTGRTRLIRSRSLARFHFELSGNLNCIGYTQLIRSRSLEKVLLRIKKKFELQNEATAICPLMFLQLQYKSTVAFLKENCNM